MTARPWNTASDEVQLATLCQALEVERGNITRAAAVAGVHRSHMMRLVKKFELTAFAAELRFKAGAAEGRSRRALGRPFSSRSKQLSPK